MHVTLPSGISRCTVHVLVPRLLCRLQYQNRGSDIKAWGDKPWNKATLGVLYVIDGNWTRHESKLSVVSHS